MLINEFTAVLTEAFEKKADKEIKAVSDKKIVAMPKFFRRILFAGFSLLLASLFLDGSFVHGMFLAF